MTLCDNDGEICTKICVCFHTFRTKLLHDLLIIFDYLYSKSYHRIIIFNILSFPYKVVFQEVVDEVICL